MPQFNEQDLKYFTGQALTGILANPYFTTPQAEKYRQMKNLTIERMAVESALGVMEAIQVVKLALDEASAKYAEKSSNTNLKEEILSEVTSQGTPVALDTPSSDTN